MSKSGNLAALSTILNPADVPVIYYAEDPPYLPRILIFYWPVQAIGSLASTSRIRTTILSAAGFKSFGAFSVAPSSSYYSAVHKLPEDKQRDDVCRGIAFALCRYFSEVPTEVKNAITDENLKEGIGLKWGQSHAAQVTCNMSKVTNTAELLEALRPFSKDRPTSPLTPARPFTSIRKTRPSFLPPDSANGGTIKFGQISTPSKRIPSSGTKRAPSASTPVNKAHAHTPNQKPLVEQLESLRFKMCEFVDTEDRYISRLQELIELVTHQGRTPKSLSSKFSSSKNQKTINAMLHFPALLDQIKDLNLAFLDDLETALQSTEDTAMLFLNQVEKGAQDSQNVKDPVGIYPFAKVLLSHFPKFPMVYREYLDLHAQISSNLEQFLKEGTTSIQQVPSLLMEPAQRISRYGLYIDTMIPHVPHTSTMAIRTLDKARKIIAEICEMEPAASTILDSLRIEHESRRRPLSPSKLLSGLTRNTGSVREAPALTGSLSKRETPRLFPSIGRSLSRKNKSRPDLSAILAEQDPDQANNIQQSSPQHSTFPRQPRNDENRPLTASSNLSLGSNKRPQTSGSMNTTITTTTTSSGAISAASPGGGSIEHYRAALMRAEEENYKLLQENAELKRQIRLCRCGGTMKS